MLSAAEPEESYVRRWTAAVNAAVSLPTSRRLDPLPVIAVEIGFEPAAWLRIFNFVAYSPLSYGYLLRLLVGAEGIVSPLLPVELSAGVAVGGGTFYGSDSGPFISLALHARASAGYRVLSWLSIGLLATLNVTLGAGQAFPAHPAGAFEFGPRISLRW